MGNDQKSLGLEEFNRKMEVFRKKAESYGKARVEEYSKIYGDSKDDINKFIEVSHTGWHYVVQYYHLHKTYNITWLQFHLLMEVDPMRTFLEELPVEEYESKFKMLMEMDVDDLRSRMKLSSKNADIVFRALHRPTEIKKLNEDTSSTLYSLKHFVSDLTYPVKKKFFKSKSKFEDDSELNENSEERLKLKKNE